MLDGLDPTKLPEQLNLAEVFLYRQRARHGARPALVFAEGQLTYDELCARVDLCSALFLGLGLRMEQRVLLMLPDVPEFAVAWFGVVKAGGVVAAVSPDLRPDEIRYYLDYTRAQLLVVHHAALERLEAVLGDEPHLRAVLVVGGPAGRHLDFERELSKVAPWTAFAATHRDDPAVWLFTSGSTGHPKAATHKQHDFVFNALTYALPVVGYSKDDVSVSIPRLAFGYALGTNLLFPLLVGAKAVLSPQKPTADHILELVARHRPTVLTGVPTALNAIASSPKAREVDFSSLRVCLSAGEALPKELYQRWKDVTGVEILDGIGSAEMFHIFISNHLGEVTPGSLGRVVAGYEAKICDEDGRELPRGEIGTLWVRGDSMALEYWHEHEKSKHTFRGDWCVSADKFFQDAEGRFFFCGRGDDMLKVNGKWLSPVEVENALLTHPSVQEAAVVAFRDQDGLEKPRAFVVLRPGQRGDDVLGEALKGHVRDRLEPYKAPRQIRFIGELPKSERGKVLKSLLRE